MEPKKSKYDTNPLDPDVVRKTEEVWGEDGGGPPTQQVKGATREVGSDGESARSNVYSEAPTRRYDKVSLDSPYPSVFVPPPYSPPSQYQPSAGPPYQPRLSQRPTSRTVLGIGLPEKWALILPYAPYVGIVASVLELFLVPRAEVRVRHQASQALALQIAIVAIERLLWIVGLITGSTLGGSLFRLAAFIFLIISMIRVAKGEPHRLTPLAEPTQWFNEHISPRT